MLSNASKNMKQNILEQFKQDAIKYLERKKYEKFKRIQEEKEYLLKQEQKYNDEQKIAKERRKRKEQQFNDYNLMLTKLNYQKQKPINGFKSITNIHRKKPVIKYNLNELDKGKSLQKREREIIMKRDIIGKYLTDENNDEELYQDLKNEKQRSQQYYREINDLQYLEYQKNNIDLYGTIDPLIIKRAKKKFLTENPYSFKLRNNFWKSNLVHNPIINPENDMNYNKYIFKEDYENKYDNNNNFSNNVNNNVEQNVDNNRYDNNNVNKTYNIFRNDNNSNLNISNTSETNNRKKSIDNYSYKRINLFKNNNTNYYMNNFIDKSKKNSSFSRYDLTLKKKFFNLNNDYYSNINNNYNDDKIYYNNFNSFRQSTPQRKILRQAVSTNFLQ